MWPGLQMKLRGHTHLQTLQIAMRGVQSVALIIEREYDDHSLSLSM